MRLYANDYIHALVMFVYTAVIISVGTVVFVDKFDVFSADWVHIGKNIVNVGFISTFTYLVKNLTTTNKGSVLGITPNNK